MLSWAEEVVLGTAMGWVVGPRDQDAKPSKLQITFLGHGMRHLGITDSRHWDHGLGHGTTLEGG